MERGKSFNTRNQCFNEYNTNACSPIKEKRLLSILAQEEEVFLFHKWMKKSLQQIAVTQVVMSKSVTQSRKLVFCKRQQGLFIIYPVAVANLQLP